MHECREACGGRAETLQRMLANEGFGCGLHDRNSKTEMAERSISSCVPEETGLEKSYVILKQATCIDVNHNIKISRGHPNLPYLTRSSW